MHTLNLGDSVYMLLRPQVKGDKATVMKKCFRSSEQLDEFYESPYQCGLRFKFEDLEHEVAPNDHEVQHNDIVVMATDGVSDNLFDEQIIEECIQPLVTREGDLPRPEDATICISALAESVSYSQTMETPLLKHALTHGLDSHDKIGGKPDDITVIVAQVKLQKP